MKNILLFKFTTALTVVSPPCAGVRNEGWFDPWLLLSAFKKKVLSMGVQYITGELSAVAVEDNRVTSVEVRKKQMIK